MVFLVFFLFNPSWGWNVLEAERLLCSWCHVGWRNTKIWIHGALRVEQKRSKCWKLSIFEGKFWVFFSYLSDENSQYTLPYSSLFTACFHHFLFWRYLNSSMTSFSSDIMLPFPNLNDLSSRASTKNFSHA